MLLKQVLNEGRVLCDRKEAGVYTHEVVDFGLIDKKGRRLGVLVSRGEEEFFALPADGPRRGYLVEPGHYFYAIVSPTRNGRAFGAGQPHHYSKTIVEREAYIGKRIGGTCKRYARLTAKGKV